MDKGKYGTNWFSTQPKKSEPKHIKVSSGDDVSEKMKKAVSGDIVEFGAGMYRVESSITVDKHITLKAADSGKVTLVFSGEKNSPLFEMNPNGFLNLKNISLKGNNNNFAFAMLKENMSALYNLKVENCDISNFNYVLKYRTVGRKPGLLKK